MHGVPEGEMKAMEYLKKDRSPKEDYKITQLFLDPEDRFGDKEWEMKYMRQAVNRGCREAQNCLRLLNMDLEEVPCENQ